MTLELAIVIIFAAGVLGGMLSFVIPHEKIGLLNFLLIISGAYIFSLLFVDILPEMLQTYGQSVMVWVLAGFFLQQFIQQFSEGIEHGHSHLHEHLPLSKLSIIILGLSVHALFEAIPIIEQFNHPSANHHYWMAIALHKVPEVFTLSCLISHNYKSKLVRLFGIIGFSSITILPLLFVLKFPITVAINSVAFGIVLGVVFGTLLQISVAILFEAGNSRHHTKAIKVLCMLAGMLLALLF